MSTAAIANDQASPGGLDVRHGCAEARVGRVDHACDEADPHPAHVAHLQLKDCFPWSERGGLLPHLAVRHPADTRGRLTPP